MVTVLAPAEPLIDPKVLQHYAKVYQKYDRENQQSA